MTIVPLRITPRAIKELGTVYSSPLDVFRELIQNAIDAKAKSMRIEVKDDYVIFEHDGMPIEGEYLDAFLTVGTDFKARSGADALGFYGIGRLSWLMIGSEAVIETGNIRMVWRESDIMNIMIERTDKRVDGVRWTIRLRDEYVGKISPKDVEDYLSAEYFGSVPIYVNEKKVTTGYDVLMESGDLLTMTRNDRVFYVEGYRLGMSIVKRVFKIGTDADFPRLVVLTEDPRVRISASRELIVDPLYREWKKEVLREVLLAIRRRFDARTAYEKIGIRNIIDYLCGYSGRVSLTLLRDDELRSLVQFIPFKTVDGEYLWGDELKPTDVWVDEPITDTSVEVLRSKGIRIIYAESFQLEHILKALGLKHARDVVLMERARVIKEDVVEKVATVANLVNGVVGELVRSLIKDSVLYSLRSASHIDLNNDVQQTVTSVSVGLDRIELRIQNEDKLNVVRAVIVGAMANTDIMFVDMEDENVKAFTDGRRIYINVRNPEVAKKIDLTKKCTDKLCIAMLWASIIVHETLHQYGLDHTDRLWQKLYEEAIDRVLQSILVERLGLD